MLRKLLLTTFPLLALFVLAACGGNEPSAEATLPPATAAPTAAPDQPAATIAEPSPTALPNPTEPPTAEPATAEPAATTAPAVLCPEVPRPALILFTGSGFELHNPLSGERCALPLPAEDVGPEFVAGGRVYFMQRDPNAATVVIARVGPDGVVEPLPATQAAGDVYYLEQFTVAPDKYLNLGDEVQRQVHWQAKFAQCADWFHYDLVAVNFHTTLLFDFVCNHLRRD